MAVLAPPPIAPEERVLLEKVSWGTYESLLADYEDCPAPRMTYDHGRLEMMMTISVDHESSNQSLASVVELVAEEWNMDFVALRSTTYRRRELELGVEPDSCYYLRNAERIRRLKKIDLSVDPPPDLVIEVQISPRY
jgi:Uma2 family endonuclease